MAHGGRGTEYVRKLRENLTCGLCLDTFNHDDKVPKVIPCQHSFCSGCLKGLLQVNRGYTVPCPVCREGFRVPATASVVRRGTVNVRINVDAFPTNLALKNLVDVLRDEEEAAERASRRLCPKHVTNEIVMVCQTCKTEVCASCIRLDKHQNHALEDLQTAYEELESEIDKVLLPELNEILDKYEHNMTAASDELNAWKELQYEIIEGRALALIAQICAWRDRNKASVEDIHETVAQHLKQGYNHESVTSIKEEIRVKQPPSYNRLSVLHKLKEELTELALKDIEVAVPEVRLSDNVGIHLPDLVTVETSSVPRPLEPTSGLSMELVASLPLIEHNWLESRALHVYDSAGGTNNDVILITDSGLVKYDLINGHFRQVWSKPLPNLTQNSSKRLTTGAAASMFRAFLTTDAIVLRSYPATARFNPYFEHEQTDGAATNIYAGDYGQLVGSGSDRLLYWTRPLVTVYGLPGHQRLCELSASGRENQWTWVAVCVHPTTSVMAVLDWGTHTLAVFAPDGTPLSTTSLGYTPAPYKSCAARDQLLAVVEYAGRGLRLHQWQQTGAVNQPNTQQTTDSDASRQPPTRHKDITTRPKHITTSTTENPAFRRDITTTFRDITTNPRDITTTSRDITTHSPNITTDVMSITTRQMGLADGDEVTCCLGWGEDDVRERRTGSVGILTLLINGNGTKRLAAYRVIINEKVEEEEQEATLTVT